MSDTENQPEPQYKPGDIVNGHRLTVQPDGSQVWLPLQAAKPAKTKPGDWAREHPRAFWITLGSVGAFLALIITIGTVNEKPSADEAKETTVSIEPGEAEEPSAAPSAEPVVEQIAVPDVTGQTAAAAIAALRAAGFKAYDVDDMTATVTATTPSAGTLISEGSAVILAVEVKPQLTLAQENALGTAQSYLKTMPFSRQGLINQMTSEYGSGYPVDVAKWAVDYLAPDWNAEAAEAAKSYLDTMSFSRDGLFKQLTSAYGSQFTPEQANAGLAAVGY